VGLFKRPYSLLELLPIAEFEFADVGPTDDVIKELGSAVATSARWCRSNRCR
jgi:hypothetical protein